MLTTSRDNTLRIWDGAKGLAERVVIKHNNNTGRWISPLRAVWSPAGDAVICGNMGRMVCVRCTKNFVTTTSDKCRRLSWNSLRCRPLNPPCSIA